MEHTTFAAAAVKDRLAGYHEVRFQAERPNQSPAKEVLDHFNVMGLPSYVVLDAAKWRQGQCQVIRVVVEINQGQVVKGV